MCFNLNIMIKKIFTKKENIIDTIHGIKIPDPYRWLEKTENQEVGEWINIQNKNTKNILGKVKKRKYLNGQLKKLFHEETTGFPSPRDGKYFFIKRKANEDLGVLYVKTGLKGKPKVLVNPNQISKKRGSVVNLHGFKASKDASLITYGLSSAGNDSADIHVMDVKTGKNLPDIIPGEFYPTTGTWSKDNDGFWYTRRKENIPQGEEKFHKKIYYHKLGTKFSEDKLVFGESFSKEDIMWSSATKDGRYLQVTVCIYSEKNIRSEIYVMDLINPRSGFVPVVKNIKGNINTLFWASIHRGFVYIHNNFRAPNWKIDRVAISDIKKGIKSWENIIPEKSDRIIEDFTLTGDRVFVNTLEDVHSTLREYSLEGKFKKEIKLPTIGSISSLVAESEGKEVFFRFNSFAYPNTIFRIDLTTRKISIYEKQKVKFNTQSISSKQVWYKSKDGTKVPMFLIYKKGLKLNSKNPTVIYGYGGFGVSVTPAFMKSIIPFVMSGGIFAIPNIRGGGEFGEAWHKAGTKKQKQNSFDDFIYSALWLIKNKYTNSSHLAISGGSNGGLLVGAVMTQKPELFKAVVMSVPVADMTRFHLFHGGRHWIPDYGDPEDPKMLPYLFSYSPYHNVKECIQYPATLIETSDKDDRVHPGQSFKIGARLQEVSGSDNILLRIEKNAGHSGAMDISRYIDKATDEWSFIFWQLGL